MNETIDLECVKCNFKCLKKGDWNRHILTQKHKYDPFEGEITSLVPDKCNKNTCLCGKIFNSRTTTWRHKKNCNKILNENAGLIIEMIISEKEEDNQKPIMITEEMVMKLLNQNNDLQKTIKEQNSKMLELVSAQLPSNNVVTTNNNTTNNTFNLQIYLNETCKDALNLTDFVSSLHVKLKDLEETAKNGYTEGVSRIFINGLNELEANMRPIHCSDAKRETLYIKNNDEWTKEDLTKSQITKAINTVSNKNIKQISEWQKKYPEYKDIESKQNDKYQEMLYSAMGGSTDEEQSNNIDKIIRNITKEVVIDKNM